MIHNQPQQAEKWVTMSHNDPVEPLQPIIKHMDSQWNIMSGFENVAKCT